MRVKWIVFALIAVMFSGVTFGLAAENEDAARLAWRARQADAKAAQALGLLGRINLKSQDAVIQEILANMTREIIVMLQSRPLPISGERSKVMRAFGQVHLMGDVAHGIAGKVGDIPTGGQVRTKSLFAFLTESDTSEHFLDNPFVSMTKENGFGGASGQSYEGLLYDRIRSSSGNLNPAQVMGMALDVCGNDFALASLAAHNLLKDATYGMRGGKPIYFDVRHGAQVLPREDGRRDANPRAVVDKLANLRPPHDRHYNEKMGSWYHMFGLFFLADSLGPGHAWVGAEGENLLRYAAWVLKHLPGGSGSPLDKFKMAANSWASDVYEEKIGPILKGMRFAVEENTELPINEISACYSGITLDKLEPVMSRLEKRLEVYHRVATELEDKYAKAKADGKNGVVQMESLHVLEGNTPDMKPEFLAKKLVDIRVEIECVLREACSLGGCFLKVIELFPVNKKLSGELTQSARATTRRTKDGAYLLKPGNGLGLWAQVKASPYPYVMHAELKFKRSCETDGAEDTIKLERRSVADAYKPRRTAGREFFPDPPCWAENSLYETATVRVSDGIRPPASKTIKIIWDSGDRLVEYTLDKEKYYPGERAKVSGVWRMAHDAGEERKLWNFVDGKNYGVVENFTVTPGAEIRTTTFVDIPDDVPGNVKFSSRLENPVNEGWAVGEIEIPVAVPRMEVHNVFVESENGGPPVHGSGIKAEAELHIWDVHSPMVAVSWTRLSDNEPGKGGMKTFYLPPDDEFPKVIKLSEEFPEVPEEMRAPEDILSLEMDIGLEKPFYGAGDFIWIQGDKFEYMTYSDQSGEEGRLEFYPEETAVISSAWEINPDSSSERWISYYADGVKIWPRNAPQAKVSVRPGQVFEHRDSSVKFNLKNRVPGDEVRITALLAESPNTNERRAKGTDQLPIIADEDHIERIWLQSPTPVPGRANAFYQGPPIAVTVEVRAGRGDSGERTLEIKGLGPQDIVFRTRLAAGKGVYIGPFQVSSMNLPLGKTSFRARIEGEEGLEDSERATFYLATMPPPSSTGGTTGTGKDNPGGNSGGSSGGNSGGGSTGGGSTKPGTITIPASYVVLMEDKYNIKHIDGFTGYAAPYAADGATSRISVCGMTMYVNAKGQAHTPSISNSRILKSIYKGMPGGTFSNKDSAAKGLSWAIGGAVSSLGAYAGKAPLKQCGYNGKSKFDIKLEKLKQQYSAPPPKPAWMK